jgi:hypothetical protein
MTKIYVAGDFIFHYAGGGGGSVSRKGTGVKGKSKYTFLNRVCQAHVNATHAQRGETARALTAQTVLLRQHVGWAPLPGVAPPDAAARALLDRWNAGLRSNPWDRL